MRPQTKYKFLCALTVSDMETKVNKLAMRGWVLDKVLKDDSLITVIMRMDLKPLNDEDAFA